MRSNDDAQLLSDYHITGVDLHILSMTGSAMQDSESVAERAKELNVLSSKVIGAGIEVHRHLGPGLLEAVYEDCLCDELTLRGIPFERQVSVPVAYKGRELGTRYRIDLVVNGMLIVELKAIEVLLPVHKAQVLTQLKLTGIQLGLLINFFVPRLAEGVKRIVNGPGLDLSVTRKL
jgi:GxxExxY protein